MALTVEHMEVMWNSAEQSGGLQPTVQPISILEMPKSLKT
jgi:hypothetical protein